MSYTTREPIAVVGSACRFPGESSSPSKLWQLLREPKDVLSEFPADKLRLSNFYNPNGEHHGSTDVPNSSYLLSEDTRLFDARFFNVNPAEADGMDPQQRLLMEVAYEGLESAGYTLDQIHGTQTSVYVGVMTSDFAGIQARDLETVGRWHGTGTSASILSNRISYYFNLKGPSMTIDTACSSSLVAVHQAVQSLRNGESSMAIVGGVNLILDATPYIAESKLHMLSPTSRSRMWDKDADGYARGEGCASVVLKTLSQAIEDGDDIECIIRETSVNSDGRSQGITMPNPLAQAELIQRTYRNAGLDPVKDRCQYFECHGTGTQAGDPVEAQAIQEAFFPKNQTFSPEDKLVVGSIKTVIGHLEGCAGLAGLLKAILCIKNRTISPNLLFNELNPKVKPFYDNLQLPTTAITWPTPPPGTPLRASVNSFGFGGTNAHAIIESYSPETTGASVNEPEKEDESLYGPLVFSANSKVSLASMIKDAVSYIESNPSLNLDDVAWTLSQKRSLMPLRASFAGATRTALLSSMEKAAINYDAAPEEDFGTAGRRVGTEPPGILGVFTGQGAQWACMGRDLILKNRVFRDSIERCESALAALPDPPSWSLKDEIMKSDDLSMLGLAVLSQPITTAIELAAVDLINAAGIHLDAVLGHSSGEIAAVYAAGIISLENAMAIAYYRGFHAKLAKNEKTGQPGAMMAVGISFDEADTFCSQPQFAGRIVLAASNAPSTVTLSGDADAIGEAKEIFDKQGTFARQLKVDSAYHSHHMIPCGGPYLESLKACNIQIQPPKEGVIWISSVTGDVDPLYSDMESLKGPYWVDNMLNAVLFSQAVETSLWNGGPFDLAIEVGPHPALKGPVSQTMKSILGKDVPYTSVMKRGTSDVEVASSAVGLIWEHLGPQSVDLAKYRQLYTDDAPTLTKGLPSYGWDHSKIHWRESRISRQYRLREQKPHELLGRRVPDDSDFEFRWRNILRLNEIPWLRGHEYQGQALFPGTGYVSLAIEAARTVAAGRPISLIEIHDLTIHRALTIEEDNSGVECVISLKIQSGDAISPQTERIEADFANYVCTDEASATLDKSCSARVSITFGEPSATELPSRRPPRANLATVDPESLYKMFESIDLNYTAPFRGIQDMSRTFHHATATTHWDRKDFSDQYLFHPAALDVSLHLLMTAFSSPYSDSLWTTYLPTCFRHICINPNLTYRTDAGIGYHVDADVTTSSATIIEGDISLFDDDGNAIVQVEGLTMRSFQEPNASNDRKLLSHTVWEQDPFGSIQIDQHMPDDEEKLLLETMDRTVLFYFQRVLTEISPSETVNFKDYHQTFYKEIQRKIDSVKNKTHLTAKPEWLNDTEEYILSMFQRFSGQADLEFMHPLGRALVPILRGEVEPLEVFLEDDRLNRLYMDGVMFAPLNRNILDVTKLIAHKHPHMDVLEIGAGTGGTTRRVLDAMDGAFSSYCYTDISSGFFEKAAEKFSDSANKMTFKVLDIERDVDDQGFEVGKYDMIVAANVLHATRNLSDTMRHTRTLLKPGGYLLLMEVTSETLVLTFLMGAVPGWWLGFDEGRVHGPGISPTDWDNLLRDTGFSGVDGISHNVPDFAAHHCSVIVSQAVDDTIQLLRDPLPVMDTVPVSEDIVILGGKSLRTSRLAQGLQRTLRQLNVGIQIIDGIDGSKPLVFSRPTSVISLTELDKPFFSEKLSTEKLQALQNLFKSSKNILWLTSGRLSESPRANMMPGIGRAIASEMPQLNLQFLDVAQLQTLTPQLVIETFLRLAASGLSSLTDGSALWTPEPELLFDGESIRIPREMRYGTLNNRFNAARRAITQQVSLDDTAVEVISNEERVIVRETPALDCPVAPGFLSVNVKLSARLLPELSRHKFMWYGTTEDSKGVIGISSHLSSVLEIKAEDALLIQVEDEVTPAVLGTVAGYFISHLISSSLPQTGSILVYSASDILSQVISLDSEWKNRKVIFADSKPAKTSSKTVSIHPRASRHLIKRALPKDIHSFIDFSKLTGATVNENVHSIYGHAQLDLSAMDKYMSSSSLHSVLAGAYDKTKTTVFELAQDSIKTVSIQGLNGSVESATYHPTIVDWSIATGVSVQLQPADPSKLFAADKSYFMVGMKSALGLSICSWMARNGARHFILASRTPEVDHLWLKEMTALGAEVRIITMDICDRDSVYSAYDEITRTMPPVAGVCNAAMVLNDKLFADMTIENFEAVWGPKVDGTTYLDEIFSSPSLDFFILFSSLSCIVGNIGQSNYHAANLFMSSLAKQRREKGLAASVIDIGMVVDVGYVARAGPEMFQLLGKLGYASLSEEDIHYLLTEAVIASNPNTTGSYEISIGLEPTKRSADVNTRPLGTPIPTSASTLSLEQQLNNAESAEEAAQVLLNAFSAKIEAMLQLASGTLDPSLSLLDLGCDSLLAVEIRTWFLKGISVDIPVLKVLNGTTLDLAAEAVAQFLNQKLKTKPEQQKPFIGESEPQTALNSDDEDSRSVSERSTGATSEVTIISEAVDAPTELATVSLKNAAKLGPMSPAQSAIWFAGNQIGDPTKYNIVVSYKVRGNFQVARFKRAIEQIVARHDILRTAFIADPVTGELVQAVLDRPQPFFNHIETSDSNAVSREFEAAKSYQWRLDQGESFRATVVTVNSREHTLIFYYHHIAVDGVSWHVFLRDLSFLYQLKSPPANPAQYIEYSLLQQDAIRNGAFKVDLDYWKEALSPLPEAMPLLPFSRVKSRKVTNNHNGHTATRHLSADLVTKIRQASQKLKGTAFHFYLTAMQVAFAKLLGIEEMCIGMSDANRQDERFTDTMGYFVNLLPLKFQVGQNASVADVFKNTTKTVLSSLQHASVPFGQILDGLNVERSPAYTPLFQVAINYRLGEVLEFPIGDFNLKYHGSVQAKTPYDLSFDITHTTSGTCMLEVTARDYLYSPEDTQLLLDIYVNLIETISANSSLKVDEYSLGSSKVAEQSLSISHGPRATHGLPTTFPGIFDAVSAKYADEVAVKDHNEQFTYSQLGKQVNQLANALIKNGVSTGDKVGVLLEPSAKPVVALLSILRIGAVYVPLDVKIPTERHVVMVDNAKVSLVLHEPSTLERAQNLSLPLINIQDASSEDNSPVESKSTQDIPAFLLHTSGSTGAPKGIVLSQAGFINYIASKRVKLGLNKPVVLQQSSLGFDMSIAQFFNAIANGGTLVIAPSDVRGDPIALSQLIRDEKVTFTLGTPSEYLALLQYGYTNLKDYTLWANACMGGEAVTDQLKGEFSRLGDKCPVLLDCYGPTEISASTTFQVVSLVAKNSISTIGQAIPNTSIYILNEKLEPVTTGLPGEICVGGVGIAKGYLAEEQTQAKFVENQFASAEDKAKGWTKMYRSGDKGRLLKDGSLVFMGRLDGETQIKLRGLRIDLEDVASVLVQAAPELIAEAVVSVRSTGDSDFLVAHVALIPQQTASQDELQQIATTLPLPQYMRPAVIASLENLPKNNNGKIDRKAIDALPLPTIDAKTGPAKYLTLREGELKLLWEEILPFTGTHALNDFFAAGGNSLLLIKLQAAIERSIGVQMSLSDLYKHSTLSGMAALINSKREGVPPPKAIDWSEETAVSKAIPTSQVAVDSLAKESGREVLLSGATSFLGKTILTKLLNDATVSKIHCVAVAREAQSSLPSDKKLVVYNGTLFDSTLNLSGSDYSNLRSRIDAVVHAGASGHCLNNYNTLRTPNLGSTRYLAELALYRNIPLHYISSPRVILFSGETSIEPVSVSSYLPPTDGSEGYTASKWASEQLLEKMADTHGLNVCIHRPCAVVGDEAPHEDALNALLRYSFLLGEIPRLENVDGFIDFKDVHEVASEIASDVLAMFTSPSKSSMVFHHHSSNLKVAMRDLAGHVAKLYTREITEVSLRDWIARAAELGMEPIISSYLLSVGETGKIIQFPYLGAN
ncbi:Hybrid PKS-NRPS synthetase lepA [Cladobotryum mycophilum]|uniref:Hybrid PKS-NRPS synthetase lepA n=1 Tax=Cladobotryum mycophilum TaxID=491253 RepID=A0ABR0SH14_9HYPO